MKKLKFSEFDAVAELEIVFEVADIYATIRIGQRCLECFRVKIKNINNDTHLHELNRKPIIDPCYCASCSSCTGESLGFDLWLWQSSVRRNTVTSR